MGFYLTYSEYASIQKDNGIFIKPIQIMQKTIGFVNIHLNIHKIVEFVFPLP